MSLSQVEKEKHFQTMKFKEFQNDLCTLQFESSASAQVLLIKASTFHQKVRAKQADGNSYEN